MMAEEVAGSDLTIITVRRGDQTTECRLASVDPRQIRISLQTLADFLDPPDLDELRREIEMLKAQGA